jgi:hypothetical protein
LIYDLSEELTDTDQYLVTEKVMERLSASKHAAEKFDVERFDLKKVYEVEVIESYETKISNKFAALVNLKDSVT